MENLRIYTVTYNVETSNPTQPLNPLLSLPSEGKSEKLPDIYVLSFQEIKAQPQNMLLDTIFADSWTNECVGLLKERDFVKLKSIRLQGIMMLVFCQRKHLLNIKDIESEYTRTGLAGMWGNKGAVSVRMTIYGCAICFVNAHLSAHDHQLEDRIEDYNTIIKGQEFHVEETTRIFFHDYVFWMGDLNFRLREEFDSTPQEIENLIKKNELEMLFQHDQLRQIMGEGRAFAELSEEDPKFPPTFKFDIGTSDYNHKRRPAWCDRILYLVNSNNYENVTLKVNQLHYKSHPEYILSDHKPVTAEFAIKVFSDVSENIIEFDPVTWTENTDNKVFYKRPEALAETKEDWIGLFRENFDSLDGYLTYEYVSKCSTPVPDQKPSKSDVKPSKYEFVFSESPSYCEGNFCLVYFSQSEHHVSTVLGISKPFPIVKNEND